MRNNQPVTDVETELPEGRFIYSTTDMKGRITEANELFVELSGFSHQELLGAPHNIVRHPDMPSEAFKDLWDTIQAGEPWSGYVKNRRKDGGFYWVHAFASPIWDNGKIIGYASVRRKPPKSLTSVVDQIYAAIRSGNSRLRVERGRAVRKGWLGRLAGASLWSRFSSSVMMLTALLAAFAAALFGFLPNGQQWPVFWMVLGGVACWLIGKHVLCLRALTLDLSVLAQTLSDVQKSGDIRRTVAIDRRDEMGRVADGYHALMADLQAILIGLGDSAKAVNEQAGNMAQASREMAGMAATSSDLATHTADAVEQMKESVESVAARSQQACESASQVCEDASRGIDFARTVTVDVQQLAAVLGGTREAMHQLAESSNEIGRVITVISEIAAQTNLLALNASIEAARAGEQGRGFAVVAGEVSKLAERTSSATAEISSIVGLLREQTERTEQYVEDGGNKIQRSVEGIEEIHNALTGIGGAARESADLIEKIAQAMKEQAVGVQTISSNMEKTADSAQNGARVSDETARASDAMLLVAEQMNARLKRLKLDE